MNTVYGMDAIRNASILRAMAARGLITYPVDSGHYYVDAPNQQPFTYKGKQYAARYLDGCFYPFVFRLNPSIPPIG